MEYDPRLKVLFSGKHQRNLPVSTFTSSWTVSLTILLFTKDKWKDKITTDNILRRHRKRVEDNL